MREMMRKAFELFVRTIWLKEIDKATREYQRAKDKVERKRYVLCKLLDAYTEKYMEDKNGVNAWKQDL